MRWNQRAELYFALSECYKEPSQDFAREVAEGILYETVTEGFVALGIREDLQALRIPSPPDVTLNTLQSAYYPLFVISSTVVLPVESVFKDRGGEGGLLAGARGMIMGPPAVDMLRRYQAQGVLTPKGFKDYPDHLALLLEYGGLLCQAEDPALGQFVAAHLDGWLEEFKENVHACTEDAFYRAVASATVAFALYERGDLRQGEPRA
ncbi:MAG: molecular chaperone [Candidatus Methylomirabilales bacterium]